ncbi:hypothetical protein HV346_17505 [Enterobacter sp. RHBSTW-00994]|uniref:hypothetical protein n=1 Tax=Enterobacteriaceae TaxID=543 RepID=UPI0015E8FFDC|nr:MULTISPECIES: hypothetical protein [Enterobacteriaceae]QLR44347.1 hypothetical protein HV346_17505 [Enterobacter sp. RHBSTW-00994]
MANFAEDLNALAVYFKKVAHEEKILFRWLYLSPEARIERLRELMIPVSHIKR